MEETLNWNDEADKRLSLLALAEARVAELAATIREITAAGATPHPVLSRRLHSAEVVRDAHQRAYLKSSERALAQHGVTA